MQCILIFHICLLATQEVRISIHTDLVSLSARFPSHRNTSEISRQHKASGEQGNKEHFTLAKFFLVRYDNLYQKAREHFTLAKITFVGYENLFKRQNSLTRWYI